MAYYKVEAEVYIEKHVEAKSNKEAIEIVKSQQYGCLTGVACNKISKSEYEEYN